jgi:hypothetical protein
MRNLLTLLERCFKSDLEREVEVQLKKLQTILEGEENRKSDDQKENGEKKSIEPELRKLALKVGASRYVYDETRGNRSAPIPELSHNIHQALQTKAMIAAVKTSIRYVAVTFVLAIIALVSLVISLISLFRGP